MIYLSPHFTLRELTKSEYALRHGLDNTPSDEVINELKLLSLEVLEHIRLIVSAPIIITSGYRSKELNQRIGGARNSQHIAGKAADFEVPGQSNKAVVDLIAASGLKFDQLIYEFGEQGWVHISRSDAPRRQILSASMEGNKTRYRPYL